MKRMLVLSLLFFLVQNALAKESVEVPFPDAIRDSIPWFAVREISDNNTPFTKMHLAEIARQSRRVALVYFATWCLPCREGLKKIASGRDELAVAGTSVVLVNVGERDTEMLMKYLQALSLEKMKSVVDPFGRLTEGFSLTKENENMALPRTLIVDSALKPIMMIGEEGDDYLRLLKGQKKRN